MEVLAPPVPGGLVVGHRRAEGEGALALPLLGRRAGVGPRGQRALAGVGQAGQRGHHRARVPVGPDDPGVGVGGQQGLEVPEVVGRLQDPPLGGLGRLQGLEGQLVLGVGRGHVGLLQPAGVGGHVGLGLEGQGAHVVHEQGDALLGQGGPEGVHGPQGRVQLHQPVELLGRLGDAGILLGSLQGRRRDEVGRLPLPQRPGHRVQAQQVGEHAGAGPRQADDDPRTVDGLLGGLAGWSRAQRWSSMRLARAALSILVMRIRPKVVSSASASHEREEHLQGLPVGVGAEVARPGLPDRRLDHAGRRQGRDLPAQALDGAARPR